jgi:hypothetical protein
MGPQGYGYDPFGIMGLILGLAVLYGICSAIYDCYKRNKKAEIKPKDKE